MIEDTWNELSPWWASFSRSSSKTNSSSPFVRSVLTSIVPSIDSMIGIAWLLIFSSSARSGPVILTTSAASVGGPSFTSRTEMLGSGIIVLRSSLIGSVIS